MADIYEPEHKIQVIPSHSRVSVSDAEAFGRVVRENQARVFAFAARMLGADTPAAQDVTQETFLRAWRQRETYREVGLLHAYLLRIAFNLCQDVLRSRRTHVVLDSCAEITATDVDVESAVVAGSLADAVANAVDRLPEGQRAVFVLSHYEQLSYREIAEALDCPIGTVASRKFLAVDALRKSLRHWIPGQE